MDGDFPTDCAIQCRYELGGSWQETTVQLPGGGGIPFLKLFWRPRQRVFVATGSRPGRVVLNENFATGDTSVLRFFNRTSQASSSAIDDWRRDPSFTTYPDPADALWQNSPIPLPVDSPAPSHLAAPAPSAPASSQPVQSSPVILENPEPTTPSIPREAEGGTPTILEDPEPSRDKEAVSAEAPDPDTPRDEGPEAEVPLFPEAQANPSAEQASGSVDASTSTY
jgi:hypothetical protein